MRRLIRVYTVFNKKYMMKLRNYMANCNTKLFTLYVFSAFSHEVNQLIRNMTKIRVQIDSLLKFKISNDARESYATNKYAV